MSVRARRPVQAQSPEVEHALTSGCPLVPAEAGVFHRRLRRDAKGGATLPVENPPRANSIGCDRQRRWRRSTRRSTPRAARSAAPGAPWRRPTAGRAPDQDRPAGGRAGRRSGAAGGLDVGKPLRQARADALALARYLEFYGGAADKLMGETVPYQGGYTVFTLREPHGVTGHIIPWNYPMQIIGRSVVAALAVGNAAVLKRAERSQPRPPLPPPRSPPTVPSARRAQRRPQASARRRARPWRAHPGVDPRLLHRLFDRWASCPDRRRRRAPRR